MPININIELLQKLEKKKFLTYCTKLHRTGLKPGTFEFVTNALTNYAIDYLDSQVFILHTLSVLNVDYFRHFHVCSWHILGRFQITTTENYELKIKN